MDAAKGNIRKTRIESYDYKNQGFFSNALRAFRLLKRSTVYTLNRNLGLFPNLPPCFVRMSVTNMCDNKCTMCGIWKVYLKDPKKIKEEATFPEFKKFVEKNSHLLDLLGISGGQVTMRKDAVKMWELLSKNGQNVDWNTNAVNLPKVKKDVVATLKKIPKDVIYKIALSVDGLGDVHDKVRGTKGEFNKLMNLLGWLREKQKKDKRIRIFISHNVTPINYKQLMKFIDYFIKRGFKQHQIFFRASDELGRFENDQSQGLFVRENKNKEIAEEIRKVQKKYPHYRNLFIKNIIKHLEKPEKILIPCYAGFSCCYIDPYWNVYPCFDTRDVFKIGNLRDYDFDLKLMWKKSPTIKKIKKMVRKGQCVNCWSLCMGGFSISSYPIQLGKKNNRGYNRQIWEQNS